MKSARLWLARLMLSAAIVLLPECAARALFPHRGLTFAETVTREQGLSETKSANERRIFVFGASSMMGYHHFGQASVSQALTFILNQSAPGHKWTIVTFAKAGEGSDFLSRVARDSLRYHPDLLLLYVGENEFSPIPVFRRQWSYRLEAQLLRWKLFRIARELAGHSPWPTVPDFKRLTWQEAYGLARKDHDKIISDFTDTWSSFLNSRPVGVATVMLYPVLSPATGPTFWNQLEKWDLDWSRGDTRDFVRGLLAAEAGQQQTAIDYFEKAGGVQSTFPLVPQYLSISLAAVGRAEEASIARHRALALDIQLTQIPMSSYETALLGEKSAAVIPLPARLGDRLGQGRLPDRLIEDGCHPTTQLEFEEAREILMDPLARVAIGYTGDPKPVSYKDYERTQGLNAEFFAKVYCRVGQFLIQGDDAGEASLVKALTFSPGNAKILSALQMSRERKAAREALHKRVLADWKAHLNVPAEEIQ